MPKDLNTWFEALEDSTAIGLDIETTSISERAGKIYNIGITTAKDGNYNSVDYFMKDIIDPSNPEKSFLAAHGRDTQIFAQGQIERGVLSDYMERVKTNNLHTVDEAYQAFTDTIGNTQGKKYILGQNLRFENKFFKHAVKSSDDSGQLIQPSTVHKYNQVTKRQGSHPTASSEMFIEYKDIVDLRNGIKNHSDANTRLGSDGHYRSMLRSLRLGDREGASSSLDRYAGQYDKIMDRYKAMISGSDQGRVPIVDLQDITRALYAKAAQVGDFNMEYVGRAASLDFLSKTLFAGMEEKHLGSADNELTDQVFKLFTAEYDKYKSNPSYRSELVQGINKNIEATNNVETTFVKGIVNRIEEATIAKNTKSLSKNLGGTYLSYSHIERNKSVREGIYNQTVQLLQEEEGTKKALDYLNSLSFDENMKDKPLTSPVSKTDSIPLHKRTGTKILAGAAVVAGASMFLGDKKGKEYNTYDELYNDMYFGSQFADWQERNNSHKLIY